MLHLPFEDRLEAGRQLAKELALRAVGQDAVVLALTRGGVPVGCEVADRLHLALDIIVVRKLGVPWQTELAMGAICGAVTVLDDRMIQELEISVADAGEIIASEQTEMQRRETLYRKGHPRVKFEGRPVILVDDGLATGSTMLAAVRCVRQSKPASLLVAVPVGSREACGSIRKEADDLVCLAIPEAFVAVGEWYREFPQVSDMEVQTLLADSRHQWERHVASPHGATS